MPLVRNKVAIIYAYGNFLTKNICYFRKKNRYLQKNKRHGGKKYEIEIHDITTNSISVYVHEATSFYDAFLTAKAMQKVYKNCWNRKTEIMRIEKIST